MPRKIAWTDAQDTQIRRLRAEGATWDMVATALAATRWAVIDRGRRIGARLPPPDYTPPPEDPNRPPLPAGDPRSWDLLVHGTALEGMPYEPPVLRR
jgi:hypothetical protein